MSTRTVLVIQPDEIAGLDRFEQWLVDGGVNVDIVKPYTGAAVPATVADHDGLIVLGGRMNALDDADHPWLGDIRSLIRDAAERSAPLLGICLGAQLIASALGGTVAVGGRQPEIGAVRIELGDIGDDPLLHDLGPDMLVAEHHHDRIDSLPDGACRLAASDLYETQAFRLGSTTWGLQFHPEVSVSSFRAWIDGHKQHDDTSAAIADELSAADPSIRGNAAIIAGRFAAVVHSAR